MIDDVGFLENIVKALVTYPEDIKIKRTVDEMGVLMTLDVHPDDMGKVIGKSGNTAKAIRILLRVVGMKNNSRINLKINEPLGHSHTGDVPVSTVVILVLMHDRVSPAKLVETLTIHLNQNS